MDGSHCSHYSSHTAAAAPITPCTLLLLLPLLLAHCCCSKHPSSLHTAAAPYIHLPAHRHLPLPEPLEETHRRCLADREQNSLHGCQTLTPSPVHRSSILHLPQRPEVNRPTHSLAEREQHWFCVASSEAGGSLISASRRGLGHHLSGYYCPAGPPAAVTPDLDPEDRCCPATI